jgi:ankyrin repeat protein
MLDAGANPQLTTRDGRSAISIAARRGRGDALSLFEQRGFPVALDGVERLMAACARNDAAALQTIVEQEPELVNQLKAEGGKLLAEFAGIGNTEGIRQLLDLGVDASPIRGR